MSTDDDPLVVDDGLLDVMRAAVASILAAKRDLIPQRGDSEKPESHPGVILSPFWPWGYPMASELLVLEQMTLRTGAPGGNEEEADAQPGEEAGGITRDDQILSATTAFLFDHLVNLVLPGGPVAPPVDRAVPANEPYEHALRSADFAGALQNESTAWKEANAVLIRVDEAGNSLPTDKYATYQDFEQKVERARTTLRDLAPTAPADERALAQSTLERLQADWLLVGHKREIEAAVQTILKEEGSQGFEDERARLLERLESKKSKRLDAIGQSYVQSELVPLLPLLDAATGPGGWRKVELGDADIRSAMPTEVLNAAGLSATELEDSLRGLQRLSFDFLPASVVREWMDTRFFSARYWRLPDGEVLSDGQGGGILPSYASIILFVRGVVAEYQDGVIAEFGHGGTDAQPRLRVARIVSADAGGTMDTARALQIARSTGLAKASKLLESREGERRLENVEIIPTRMAGAAGTGPVPPVRSGTRTGLFGVTAGRFIAAARERLSAPSPPRRHVRDFRTAPPPPRRQVRDFRTAPPPPRRQTVRDHRRSEDVRVGPRSVDVEVEITGEQEALDGIELFVEIPDGPTTQILLQRSSTGQLTSRQQISVSRRVKAVTAVLQDSQGQQVSSMEVSFDADHLKLMWKVATKTLQIALTSATIPTLFGYVATPVPPCPNPDPALTWST